jgi:glyoxylase-like metal-dependent hydrolase (beta-lactamase superfamily II)
VSHAIPNHFAGVYSVLEVHKKLGLKLPKVHKKLDGNINERNFFERHPDLKGHILNLQEGQKFDVEEAIDGEKMLSEIGVIETPGHRNDHCSFSLRNDSLH